MASQAHFKFLQPKPVKFYQSPKNGEDFPYLFFHPSAHSSTPVADCYPKMCFLVVKYHYRPPNFAFDTHLLKNLPEIVWKNFLLKSAYLK